MIPVFLVTIIFLLAVIVTTSKVLIPNKKTRKEVVSLVIVFFLVPVFSLSVSYVGAAILTNTSTKKFLDHVVDNFPQPQQIQRSNDIGHNPIAHPSSPTSTMTTTTLAQNEPSAVPMTTSTEPADLQPEIVEPPAGSDTPIDPKPEINGPYGMKFVLIKGKTFMMGNPEDEQGMERLHKVTINRDFYLQTKEVTQRQWKAAMGGNNPSYFKNCGDDCPVEQVSWNDVQEFIERLNAQEGEKVYRLPTEAEWEYAARAGTQTAFAFGDCLSTDQANYNGNLPLQGCPKGKFRRGTIPVGSLKANGWGLYDMHGNVYEWCQDRFNDNYYLKSPEVDQKGSNSSVDRTLRGGSWESGAASCRSPNRGRSAPNYRFSYVGFRLLRSSP